MILEIINAYAPEILGAILTALAGVVGLAIKKLATRYINTEVKREIALTVVQGVEQVYKTLDGPAKLEKALESAASMLQANGIKVTDLELRMLIEAAVGEFNDVFNKPLPVLEGIDVEDLTDEQIRDVLAQLGIHFTEEMTRDELINLLPESECRAVAGT